MNYFLDTNICRFIINQKPLIILERFQSLSYGSVGVSSITVAELYYDAQNSQQAHDNTIAVDGFVSLLKIHAFDTQAATSYGALRAILEKSGTGMGVFDCMIGAHAQSLQWILVTNTVKEFTKIPGLLVENWVNPQHGHGIYTSF